ncbi:MAG: hypothetical protein SOR61_03765 [Evtepia sp.]|uniref:hypothetical protein n=1 Tax=Evtepia sp. TaxID=2773933 RepID=UPI002A74D6CB|nr:hypothetical protein [Evtepia sp.]MDY3014301.1 hypothetical protein [Evtepia sp.]
MEEKSFRRMLTGAGIVMLILGALLIWKAIVDVIPASNLYYGSFYLFGGGVIALIGLALLVVPRRKRRKQAKKEETP